MSKYFVFQIPYQQDESQFLLRVLQTAAKVHREFHERSTLATDLHTDPETEGAAYLLIKEEMDDPESTPVSGSLL